MFRLMCKSRTRNIRRMIFSAMTAFAILVQALSVSFESEAASTYPGGTISWNIRHGDALTMSADSFSGSSYSPSNYNYVPVQGYPNGTTVTIGDPGIPLLITFNNEIPAYSRIDISLWFAVDHGSVSSSHPSFYFMSGDLSNPDACFDYNASVRYHNFTSNEMAFIFQFTFWLQQPIEVIAIEGLQLQFTFPATSSGDIRLAFIPQTTISYEAVGGSSIDILNDIKNNTQGTIDAVNDQTQEVTQGYDNSQTVNDNEQLAGAMQDYDDSQSAAVGDSTGYIDDVSFFDPSSSAQVMSGITLTGSFLQSLFENLGQWGAVVMVSLSLTFGLMLVGWFKFRK